MHIRSSTVALIFSGALVLLLGGLLIPTPSTQQNPPKLPAPIQAGPVKTADGNDMIVLSEKRDRPNGWEYTFRGVTKPVGVARGGGDDDESFKTTVQNPDDPETYYALVGRDFREKVEKKANEKEKEDEWIFGMSGKVFLRKKGSTEEGREVGDFRITGNMNKQGDMHHFGHITIDGKKYSYDLDFYH